MNRIAIVALLLVSIARSDVLCAVPAAGPANDFTRMQALYTSAVASIDAKYLALQTNAAAQYFHNLDSLEKAFQQKGDLESVLAVRAERQQSNRQTPLQSGDAEFKRFLGLSEDPQQTHLNWPVPKPDSSADPEELRRLKANMRALPAKMTELKSREMNELVVAYIARLEGLQRDLTKQGQIDLATAVHNEMDKIKRLPNASAQYAKPAKDATVAAAGMVSSDSGPVPKAWYASRTTDGRKVALDKFGGSKSGEEAVMRALRWFKVNQDPDGSWRNADRTDPTAMAGLVLLCFLAHSEAPDSPEFGQTVKKAMEYVISKQGSSGTFGREYTHGICTYALCEAFVLTKHAALTNVIERALDALLNGQQPQGGYNYKYAKDDRWDLSVAGWQFQAMKAAKMAGIGGARLDSAIALAVAYLRQQAFAPNRGGFGYSGRPGVQGSSATLSMTGDGTFCLQLLGYPNVPEVRAGLAYMKDAPCVCLGGTNALIANVAAKKKNDAPIRDAATKNNVYAWYYITHAEFQAGGSDWYKWNTVFSRALVSGQENDGHWENGDHGGPVYTTAFCCLTLQTYYRYPRISALAMRSNW